MLSRFRAFSIFLTCLILLNTVFGLIAQDQTILQNTQKEEKVAMAFPAPAAVPVLTPEEAEIANQEAFNFRENGVEKKIEWIQDYNYRFLKHSLLVLLCMIPISFAACFFIKRKQIKKTDYIKSIISLFCSILLLLLLFSAIPYFYDFWSVGNLLLGCVIWYLLFRHFDRVFFFTKKDIVLVPLLLVGTWGIIFCINPHMRDTPNTIVLKAQTNNILTFDGTISQNPQMRAKNDFFAHYKYIEWDGDWKQTGSYTVNLKKNGTGKITLYIPTELIQNYLLSLRLKSESNQAQGTLSINGQTEIPWQMTENNLIMPLSNWSHLLYPDRKNCPVFFLFLCVIGSFLATFLFIRLIQRTYSLYFENKQKAYELALAVLCILFFVINLKSAFFIDNCPDLNTMASASIVTRFSTKHPAMIYAWWMTSRFFSPFESINAAFVFGTLISFWGGMWLLGSYLIRKKQAFFSILIILPCINLVSSTIYASILVDQIVVSSCLLTIGLCTRLSWSQRNKRIILIALIPILIMVLSSVRLEGLLYSFPISVIFVSLTILKNKKGFKRVFLSGLLGGILTLALFSCYRFVITPYILHARVMNSTASAADSLYIEALGICYFEKDWDDLPDFFTDEAKANLDKTKFIERTRPYTTKYVHKNGFSAEGDQSDQLRDFWLHMIKKYPLTYLHVKWISNQVLWRIRPLYYVPLDVRSDVVPEKTGLSLEDFFRDGITTFGLVLPSWIPQLSLLFITFFVGILLFNFNDNELWIIWGIGASGFLHNFAFFLVAGGTNYRYIFWADTAGRISFILSILVIQKLLEYKQKKISFAKINNTTRDNDNETFYPDTLFQ